MIKTFSHVLAGTRTLLQRFYHSASLPNLFRSVLTLICCVSHVKPDIWLTGHPVPEPKSAHPCALPFGCSGFSHVLAGARKSLQKVRQRSGAYAFFVTMLLMFFVATPSLAAQDRYAFKSQTKQEQFIRLSSELRCLVCQNQNLADSNAGLANDLRQKLYVMVLDNKTDHEIKHYFTERYGDFILFSPPLKSSTYFLWLGPILFLLLGVFIITWFVHRNRSH